MKNASLIPFLVCSFPILPHPVFPPWPFMLLVNLYTMYYRFLSPLYIIRIYYAIALHLVFIFSMTKNYFPIIVQSKCSDMEMDGYCYRFIIKEREREDLVEVTSHLSIRTGLSF